MQIRTLSPERILQDVRQSSDQLIDLDIDAVLAQHRSRQSVATVVLQQQGTGDVICLDATGKVTDSSPSGESWHNTGVYLLEPQILEKIPPRTPFNLSRDLLPALLADGLPVHGYKADSYWNEMTTFADYHAAQCAYLHQDDSSRAYYDDVVRTLETRQIAQGIWVGRNHVIHPSVRLAPPVYIGDNCQIGRDVELGPDVVIGKNVVIDDGDPAQQRSDYSEKTLVGSGNKEIFAGSPPILDLNRAAVDRPSLF